MLFELAYLYKRNEQEVASYCSQKYIPLKISHTHPKLLQIRQVPDIVNIGQTILGHVKRLQAHVGLQILDAFNSILGQIQFGELYQCVQIFDLYKAIGL